MYPTRLRGPGIVLMMLCLGLSMYAQSDRGSITGLVTDSSGASIPHVIVTATNAATNTVREAETSDTGRYVFQELPAGTYNLSIKHAGFRSYAQNGITVGVSQAVTQDVALQVGAVTEAVEVHADASMLKTESAEVSTSVTPEKLSALPIDFGGAMRNPMSFLRLVPGASVSRDQSWPVTSQNGLQSFTEEIRIDGAASTNPTPGVFNEAQPSVDAIQEINVQTANFNAEYGQAGGAIMNFTLKSGTNDVHGTVYDYLRNEFFNAKNKDTGEKTTLRRQEFGGTLGGPLVIPKVYNGRNRTFWFTSYEQYRDREKGQGYYNVPRDEWRNGDLSSLLTGNTLGTDVLGRPFRAGSDLRPGHHANGHGGRATLRRSRSVPEQSDSDAQRSRQEDPEFPAASQHTPGLTPTTFSASPARRCATSGSGASRWITISRRRAAFQARSTTCARTRSTALPRSAPPIRRATRTSRQRSYA